MSDEIEQKPKLTISQLLLKMQVPLFSVGDKTTVPDGVKRVFNGYSWVIDGDGL